MSRIIPPPTAMPAERKEYPLGTGVLDYFPDALAYVAHVSFKGGQQHSPGKPLFWDRSKSGDESDAIMRHYVDRFDVDTDGVLHAGKMAWRALAFLQKLLEQRSKNCVEVNWLNYPPIPPELREGVIDWMNANAIHGTDEEPGDSE